MRKPFFLVALVLFSLSICLTSYADAVVVPGNPPITQLAVDTHIRLIEFVLKTRLTVWQKNSFQRAIRKECQSMPEGARKDFLEALELVKEMKDMTAQQHEIVRKVLEKDYQESAVSLPADPAAKLYLNLQKASLKMVAEDKESGVSLQSFEALIEYLGFVASPDKPKKIGKRQKEAIKSLLKDAYPNLTEDEKSTLDDFQLTWHVIRGAWAGADVSRKNMWKLKFASCRLNIDQKIELKDLKTCISTDTFGELIDEAFKLGVSPVEWSQLPKFRVW